MFLKTKVMGVSILWLVLSMVSAHADQTRADVLKSFTKEQVVEIGDKVYNTTGENTCLKCHRAGQGEGWAGAADLRKPWHWNSFSGLGGYEAMEKDPEKFRKEFYTVLEYLIANGGIKFNQGFKKDHPEINIDWSKTYLKKKDFDMMMWGSTQGPTKEKIKTIKADLAAKGVNLTDNEMKDLAVYAVLEYIKALEEPNKKEDGTALPKIHASGQ